MPKTLGSIGVLKKNKLFDSSIVCTPLVVNFFEEEVVGKDEVVSFINEAH